ncbi:MAG: universal stress protein [Peptococcaceae bacterium]|nr:universal stress protein [Peptococcaceae bacterium]
MKIKALLCSDGSERSLSAALYATGLMRGNPGMELTLISFADMPRGPMGLTRDEETASAAVVSQVSSEIIQETKKIFDQRQITVGTAVGTIEAGSLAAEITRFADEGKYNLIIMGTKGSTDLKALVTGSLARAVVRASHCPVLLVKKLPAEILASLGQ